MVVMSTWQDVGRRTESDGSRSTADARSHDRTMSGASMADGTLEHETNLCHHLLASAWKRIGDTHSACRAGRELKAKVHHASFLPFRLLRFHVSRAGGPRTVPKININNRFFALLSLFPSAVVHSESLPAEHFPQVSLVLLVMNKGLFYSMPAGAGRAQRL